MTNTALRLHGYGGAAAIQIDPVPDPVPRPGQLVVEVAAAGINPIDRKIRDGFMRNTMHLELPAVLGLELAGRIVEANGHSVFRKNDRVMGPVGGIGAYARYVAVDAVNLCRTPSTLDDAETDASSTCDPAALNLPVSLMASRLAYLNRHLWR